MAEIKKSQLPHNYEAEKAVLGAMLRSSTILNDAASRLAVDDFFDEKPAHRIIFGAMQKLYKESVPVDVQTVVQELINIKEFDNVGGIEYLSELADSIITFANVPTYIKNIRDCSIMRKFLLTLDEIELDYLKNPLEDPNNFLNIAESKINRATEMRNIADFRPAKEIANSLANQLANLKVTDTDDTVTGVPTGYSKLNKITHGFQKDNFIVLAARTGVGKTALSLNLAFNAAVRGYPVAYFSLEMSAEDLFKRLVSGDSNVQYNTLLTGYHLGREERLKLQQSCNRIGALKFYVEETTGINLIELVAKVKKLKANEPDLALVFVDYIGLVKVTGLKSNSSRQLEIQEISTTLKKLALELHITIVCVAQLNRNVEQRGGEPMLSDLRESGSLEQDADIVMLLSEAKAQSPKAFGRGNKEQEDSINQINSAIETVAIKEGGSSAKIINVIIAKNRAGQQGRVPLLFRKDYVKFDTPSPESESALESIESARLDYLAGE